jgi:hypothetical protein
VRLATVGDGDRLEAPRGDGTKAAVLVCIESDHLRRKRGQSHSSRLPFLPFLPHTGGNDTHKVRVTGVRSTGSESRGEVARSARIRTSLRQPHPLSPSTHEPRFFARGVVPVAMGDCEVHGLLVCGGGDAGEGERDEEEEQLHLDGSGSNQDCERQVSSCESV